MSECIICQGTRQLEAFGFSIENACDYLMRGAYWLGETEDIWTFRYQGKEIDCIITEAYDQMHNGIQYQDTQMYKVLNCLMDNDVCFAMWYCDYVEELDLCNTRTEVLKTCYNQIMDKSGMCEVYVVSNILKG